MTTSRAHPEPTRPELTDFAGQWAVLLTSHRRDGTGVGTAVNLAVEGDHAYFRTPGKAKKVRRLRRDPLVELAPATPDGKPVGPEMRARVRLLDHGSEEDRHAARLLRRKYPVVQGALVPLAHRLMRTRTLHYEVRTAPADGAA
ncbi:PPOX class F420-dependent oxidoreductase [Streptomyces sp. NWU339]|uniref:PPOX class F420-dependent oxidoreductase n=1 Tax=Streptomyces sp. NWU339 TaxID=2185284 RepID=UPI000D674F46|nr:PPOX class F420-dependent oxidoreductase [Streptomyces sp. NWU339]PWI09472.1 PPOX class F420-dependent oxidoreductase [Streptomyces sp. NWU339]